jgi:heterodisulfide reductase subunit C
MFDVRAHSLPHNAYSACTGCSLCLLVCPVWRKSHDIRLTPHGRAKALQHGATIADITESIESCTLCGACEPACPERIDLVGMIVGLRRQLPRRSETNASTHMPVSSTRAARRTLLAGSSLRDHPETLTRIVNLLGLAVADDDGADIALALETGSVISPERLEQFLTPLRRAGRLFVADGLLHRHLRGWLPRAQIVSLGAALSSAPAIRQRIHATDLYVIEARGYHADYERQVRHYDALRAGTGCAINLDLQRIAIPATARNLAQLLEREAPDDADQARWILQGRAVSRIVVESVGDIAAFAGVADCPVIHVAHLLDADVERGA